MELDAPIGLEAGWVGCRRYEFESELDGAVLTAVGYPSDVMGGGAMTRATGTCVKVMDSRLAYSRTLDTAGGMSGAPLFMEDEAGAVAVVGVHTRGSTPRNKGTRLTAAMLAVVAAARQNLEPVEPRFAGQRRFRFRRSNLARVKEGRYVTWEFDLPAAPDRLGRRPSLRWKVKRGTAHVERPDGTALEVLDRHVDLDPPPGRYRVWVTATHEGRRHVKLKVVPSWTW
jgi:hypothetical protein